MSPRLVPLGRGLGSRAGRWRLGLWGLGLVAAATSVHAEDAAPAPTAPQVRVEDGHGAPVADAGIVDAVPFSDGLSLVDEDAPAVVAADAQGVLTLPLAPASGGARRVVRARGRPLAALDPLPSVLRLPPSPPLRGRLERAGGRALGPVVVLALPMDAGEPFARRVRPAPDGSFAFTTLVPEARYRLEVRRPDGAWAPLGDAAAGADLGTRTLPAGATLRGRVAVASPAGPAADVGVRLRRIEPLREDRATVTTPAVDPMGEPDTVADLRTGADGRFTLAEVPPGVYEAVLTTPGVLWDGEAPRIEVRAAVPVRLETFWVVRRGAIVGRVLDPKTKAPMADVRVRALPPPDLAPVVGGLAPATGSTSGADGRFRLDGLAPAAGWTVLVEREGRSPVVAGPVEVSGGRDVPVGDVRPRAAWTLELSVSEGTGRPVAGARVRAVPAERPVAADGGPLAVAFVRRGETDAEGRVTLPDMPEGDAQLVVLAPGFVEAISVVPEGVPATTRTVRVELVRTPVVEGRLESDDGPLPPLVVRVLSREGGPARRATPDASGRFRVEDAPAGPLDVEAVSPDGRHVYARREAYLPASGELLALVVPPARRIEGEAEGLERAGPAATVRLEALRLDLDADELRPALVETLRLPVGSDHAPFRFGKVPAGRYAVRVVQGLRDTGPLPVVVEADDVTGLVARLPRGARVSGQVLDARREAAALGVRVSLVRLDAAGVAPADGPPAVRVTDEDGRFEFPDVAAGVWRLEASDRDVAPSRVELRVAEGEDRRVDGLVVGEGGRLEGRVADERARAVGALSLRVLRLPDLEDAGRVVTRDDGSFRSAPLAAGRYRVVVPAGVADRPGVEADVDVVEGETTTVDFTANDLGRIDGTVRRRSSVLAGVLVEAVLEAARGCDTVRLAVRTDAWGQFHFAGLPEGAWRLRTVDGSVRTAVPVLLRRGDRVTRDLEVGEGRVVGVARYAGGAPVVGATVFVLPRDRAGDADASSGRVRTGPDGRFEVGGLPVARYRVVVMPEGRAARAVEDVVAEPAGQERPVEVWFGVGGRLDVRVLDDRNRAVMAAAVWVETPAGVPMHVRPLATDGAGRVTIDGLPEGPAQVRVVARDHGRPRPVPVVVREGVATPADVRLLPSCAVRLVVTAGRDPVARARVEVRREGGEVLVPRAALRRPTDDTGFGVAPRTGVLVLDDLEEGTYRIRVTAGRELEPTEVVVVARPSREPTTVRVSLPFAR